MAELINAGEPAIMFGHWAGFYSNGSRKGFAHCKKVIISINKHYADKTIWMKSSELARYQAARELTKIEKSQTAITLTAPFAAPAYTLRFAAPTSTPRQVTQGGQAVAHRGLLQPQPPCRPRHRALSGHLGKGLQALNVHGRACHAQFPLEQEKSCICIIR